MELLGSPLGCSEETFGVSCRPLGNLLRGLDGSGGGLLVIWEASWEDLGASWGLLERSWNLLEEFREPPGTLLGTFGRVFGGHVRAWDAS